MVPLEAGHHRDGAERGQAIRNGYQKDDRLTATVRLRE